MFRPGAASRSRGSSLAGHVGEDLAQLGVGQFVDLGAEEDLGRPPGRGQAGSPWTSRVSSSASRRWLSRVPGLGCAGGVERFDFFVRQLGQEAQALAGVGVVDVDPVLVELVGAGARGESQTAPRLGLAHLACRRSW